MNKKDIQSKVFILKPKDNCSTSYVVWSDDEEKARKLVQDKIDPFQQLPEGQAVNFKSKDDNFYTNKQKVDCEDITCCDGWEIHLNTNSITLYSKTSPSHKANREDGTILLKDIPAVIKL